MPLEEKMLSAEIAERYFDWAATAIPDEEILREALEESLEFWQNPSSAHSHGKRAKAALDEARKKCAAAFNARAENIFFTSGGTESNHIPLLSILNRPERGEILFSSIEHPAVREMSLELKHCGFSVRQIPCDKRGIVTAQNVRECLTDETLFVSVMAVNNETGAIQPIDEIARTLDEFYKGRRRPKFHVDCVQALGKIPLDISKCGIDSAAASAHKICGPRGIGILYLKNPIEPFLRGGGQEGGIRSGTENLFGAAAFAKCIEHYAGNSFLEKFEAQKKLAADFIKRLSTIKSCRVIPPARAENPSDENFSPWIVQASFGGIPGNVMLRALDAKGFAISTGSACSSKKASRPVLEAMGIEKDLRENSVRFSFGPLTTAQAMDALFEEVKNICGQFSA